MDNLLLSIIMFTDLNVHSHYSLLEAIGKPKELVARAKELNMEALALTDYGGLYGCIEFFKAAKKEGIKPLLGVEVSFVHNIEDTKEKKHSYHYKNTIVLIAKNNQGYHDLLQLVSKANTDGYQGTPHIDFSLLKEFGQNLIVIQGGKHSFIGGVIMKNESVSKQKELLSMMHDACGKDNVYLSLSAWDEADDKAIKAINEGVLTLHQETGIPLIISNNVHYIAKEDKKPYGVALSIKDGKRVFDDDRRLVTGDRHLLSKKELDAIMTARGYERTFIDGCFETIASIIEKCTVELELNKLYFPNYNSPEEIVALYEQHKECLITE